MRSYPGGIRYCWNHVRELGIVCCPEFSYGNFPINYQVDQAENPTGQARLHFAIVSFSCEYHAVSSVSVSASTRLACDMYEVS